MFYDAILLLAILFLATAIALPFNGGKAFTPDQYLYPAWLFWVSFLFYTWFWTHGGQTLGLKSWKMVLRTESGKTIGWPQACIRFFSALLSWACLGLGFLWILIDPEKQAWHDKLSGTKLSLSEEQK